MDINSNMTDPKDKDIILNALRMGASLEDIATLAGKSVREIEMMQVSLPTLYKYTQDVAENCYLRGVTDGMVKGEDRLGRLISRLFSDGQTANAERAANDKKVRNHFFKKYGI